MFLSLLSNPDVPGESNGYSALDEGQETEPPGGDPPTNDACVHSSEEDEEKGPHKHEQQDERSTEGHVAAHDCSGSRPLLMDSEDEEEQGSQLELHSSTEPAQPSATYHHHQPAPSTLAQNNSQHVQESSHAAKLAADVFSKAPFRIGQDDANDVFANAPFPRAHLSAQQQLDVFSQAPFGKRRDAAGALECRGYSMNAGGIQGDQGALGQVAQQPFRPQALAKYSRHFEGPLPQQPVAAHQVVSNVNRQAAVASVPVGPRHSWTSDASPVDPFVSAPFHLKAPQEKP